jgi:ATP-dependent protease HslVU (ClpYQ) peptidase subunit
MTCIIGVRHGGRVWMGAEGRTVAGASSVLSDETQKLIHCGAWCLGSSGPSRMRNLLQENAEAFGECATIGDLARLLGDRLREDGWSFGSENGPGDFRAGVLVGRGRELFYIGGDRSYNPIPEDTPTATGSGCEYAQGAAAALLGVGVDPVTALESALRIACRYESGCGGKPEVVFVGERDLVKFPRPTVAEAAA